MRILILSVSTLLLVGRANAGIQSNGIQSNGIQSNGIQSNGIQSNGIQSNGIQSNGIQSNGVGTSGVSYSGVTISGTQMTYLGQSTSVFPYTCSHREDATGAALNNCSACSMNVGNADSYCKNIAWDSVCVNEAKTTCTLGAGTVISASFTDGRTARMQIDSVSTGGSSVWNGSVYMNMSDVTYNRLSWVLDHAPSVVGGKLLGGMNSCTNQVCNVGDASHAADSYCCSTSWDGICAAEANAECGPATGTVAASSTAGDSVCGNTGSGVFAMPVQAVFLAGVWDQHWGAAGNGSKSSSSSMFTIACRGIGAYAKCLDMGYKPWLGTATDNLHQTCVRMVRADYCGDGNSFTTNGHLIDVDDYFAHTADSDIQFYASSYNYEASWFPGGARFADHYRTAYQASAYDGTPVNAYIGSRSAYCSVPDPWSGPGNSTANGTSILITNKAQ
jgi:hypothetical protein